MKLENDKFEMRTFMTNQRGDYNIMQCSNCKTLIAIKCGKSENLLSAIYDDPNVTGNKVISSLFQCCKNPAFNWNIPCYDVSSLIEVISGG